jgi:transposase
MLSYPEPPGYQMQQPRSLRSLKPHHEFIQQILKDDTHVRRKQKHTAARIYERLCKERGYQGSDRSVRELVAKLKIKQQEVFIPLAQPMSKGQADLFEGDVEMFGELMRVYVFVMALAYSDAVFAMAFPFKKQETWLVFYNSYNAGQD